MIIIAITITAIVTITSTESCSSPSSCVGGVVEIFLLLLRMEYEFHEQEVYGH